MVAASTSSLATLVAPMPVDTFLREVYGRRFHHFRGERGRFSSLLSWARVLELLADGVDPTRVQLLVEGRQVPSSRFCVSGPDGTVRLHRGMVHGLLEGGAALLVAQLHHHHRPLLELAQTLELGLRAGVNVNVYVGGEGSRGFDLHVDHHDVFVLQVLGKKQWYVAEPTCPAPLRVPEHNGPPPSAMSWSGVLEEGDVLYLPRGFWHRAEATADAPTLHLSCGVQPCTGLHLLEWLAKDLMGDARFRAELPRLVAQASLDEHIAQLRVALSQLLDRATMERFLSAHDERTRQETEALSARVPEAKR